MGGSAWGGGNDALELWETENRSGMLLTIEDKPGMLSTSLGILAKHGVSLTQIKSKPPKKHDGKRSMNFHIDFEGSF